MWNNLTPALWQCRVSDQHAATDPAQQPTAGGGLLGWIGGGMLVTDPALPERWREVVPHSAYLASALGALLVIVVGKWLASRQHQAHTTVELISADAESIEKGKQG